MLDLVAWHSPSIGASGGVVLGRRKEQTDLDQEPGCYRNEVLAVFPKKILGDLTVGELDAHFWMKRSIKSEGDCTKDLTCTEHERFRAAIHFLGTHHDFDVDAALLDYPDIVSVEDRIVPLREQRCGRSVLPDRGSSVRQACSSSYDNL